MMTVNKSQLTWLLIITAIVLLVVVYGVYEKNRKEALYSDFKTNKKIICGDVVVQRGKGWRIHNNKFFTNGKIMKTIVFCKSSN